LNHEFDRAATPWRSRTRFTCMPHLQASDFTLHQYVSPSSRS
jgi:hypothetical protein